eukprot:TRINITY_DN8061_c0_g3_i1.p1 TRINITY_DN8061_c0_g3~~TRINITY_DN8061_c0_g3_i1.p1  ORF type:complete len:1350 (+),score=349.69 TRINITY_DN8061_c0_g3_i1:96-4145(+)
MAKSLDFSKASSYDERAKVIADVRTKNKKEIEALLAELSQGGTYEALLATKVCRACWKAAPDATQAALLKLVGQPSVSVVKAAARAVVEFIKDDAAVVKRFSELCKASQRTLLKAASRRRGPDGKPRQALCQQLLPKAKEDLGLASCAALYRRAEPADWFLGLDPAVANRVKWSTLAASKPEAVIKRIEALLSAAKPWSVASALGPYSQPALWKRLSQAPDKKPLVRLLQHPLASHLPLDAGMWGAVLRPVLRKHLDEVLPLVKKVTSKILDKVDTVDTYVFPGCIRVDRLQDRTCLQALKLLPRQTLQDIVVADLARDANSLSRSKVASRCAVALQCVEASVRGEMLAAFRRVANVDPCEDIVKQLSGDALADEARRLAEALCDSAPETQMGSMVWQPWDDAGEDLQAACKGVPDESERRDRVKRVLKCAIINQNLKPALDWATTALLTETDVVRSGFVNALAVGVMQQAYKTDSGEPRLLRNTHVPMLKTLHSIWETRGAARGEAESWRCLAAQILRHALTTGTHTEQLAIWAAKVAKQMDTMGFDKPCNSFGAQLPTVFGKSPLPHSPYLYKNLLLDEGAFNWLWNELVTFQLKCLKDWQLAEIGRVSEEQEKIARLAEYWETVLGIAEVLAEKPQRLLFKSSKCKPLLDELLGVLNGSENANSSCKERVAVLLLKHAEAKEAAVAYLQGNLKELMSVAASDEPPALSCSDAGLGGAICRLAAAEPEKICDLVTKEELGDNGTPWWGLPTFTRWTPEQQQAFLDRQLKPRIEEQAGKMIEDAAQTKRPLARGEKALRMVGKLSFIDTKEFLQSQLSSNQETYLKLVKKEREAVEALKDGREADQLTDEEKTPRVVTECLTWSALIALGQSEQDRASAVVPLRQACQKLPGKAGRLAAQALRKASAYDRTSTGVVAALLQRQDLAAQPHQELLNALAASQPQLLSHQWNEFAPTAQRCKLIEMAGSIPAQYGLDILENAAKTLQGKPGGGLGGTRSSTLRSSVMSTRNSLLALKAGVVPEPFDKSGYQIALQLCGVSRKWSGTPSNYAREHQRRFISQVLGHMLRLTPNPKRRMVRLRVLEEMSHWVKAVAGLGDPAGLSQLLASLARVFLTGQQVRLGEDADLEELQAAARVVVEASWNAGDEAGVCFKALLSMMKSDWDNCARLMEFMLWHYSSLPCEQRALSPIEQAAKLLSEDPDLSPLAFGFKMLALPWGDKAALPKLLAKQTFFVDEVCEEQFLTIIEKIVKSCHKGDLEDVAIGAALEHLVAQAEAGSAQARQLKALAYGLARAVVKMSSSSWAKTPGRVLTDLQADSDPKLRQRVRWLTLQTREAKLQAAAPQTIEEES